MKKTKWIKIGDCAVDSGQIMIVDPCYVLPGIGEQIRYTYNDLLGEYEKPGVDDKQAFEVLFSKIAGTGIISSTGLGDGVYPVYAKIEDQGKFGKRVMELKIKFN